MKTTGIVMPLAVAVLVMGCRNTGPSGAVSLSFAGQPAGIAATSAVFTSSAAPAADVLVISKAEVVLREVELKAIEVANCDATPKPDSCEEFALGPIRLNIPTTSGATTQVTVDIPPGTYKEVDFEVHKISLDDPAEAAFRAANPDLAGKSIRVTGTFNGQAFTFESDLDVEQELQLVPALVVTDAGAGTNLTVRINLNAWFRNGSGALIDPATASKGQPNESIVIENIKRSMHAFEDRDHDGNEG